jgi:sugar O-acyltransferase (sialic acid O-acetyltransferase NeuD family)
MKKDLIIIGDGQFARLVFRVINRTKDYRVAAFIGKKTKRLCGIKVYPFNFLKSFRKKYKYYVLAVGDILIRKKLISSLKKKGFNSSNFPVIIDPSCILIDGYKNIRSGTIILPNSTLLNDVKIGRFNIIGTSVKILHNSIIGNNCVIGGGSIIGANVTINNEIFVGVGATFCSKKIKVGSKSFVCAGSVILKNVRPNSKIIGNPAKEII